MKFVQVLLLWLVMIERGCRASSAEDRLLADLLIGYNKMARPVFKPFQTVHVKLGVSLREAIDLNEDLGQVTTLLWLKMVWKDVYLSWDPQQFGGIEKTYIPHDRVWTPDITLYNALNPSKELDPAARKVTVTFKGEVTWIRPVTYTVTCKHQFRGNAWLCPFTFGSWVYDMHQLDIHGDKDKVQIDDEYFLPGGHFLLLGHEGKREVVKYKCCGGPFTTMNYLIKLRNKIGPALLGRK